MTIANPLAFGRLEEANADSNYNGVAIQTRNTAPGNVMKGIVQFSKVASEVKSATLQCYATTNTGAGYVGKEILVYLIIRDFVPAQGTWNIFSTGNSWQTGGATGALDQETVNGAASNVPSVPAYQTWDVKAMVNDNLADAMTNLTFKIATTVNASPASEYVEYAADNTPALIYFKELVGKINGVSKPAKINGVTYFSTVSGVQ